MEYQKFSFFGFTLVWFLNFFLWWIKFRKLGLVILFCSIISPACVKFPCMFFGSKIFDWHKTKKQTKLTQKCQISIPEGTVVGWFPSSYTHVFIEYVLWQFFFFYLLCYLIQIGNRANKNQKKKSHQTIVYSVETCNNIRLSRSVRK